MSRQKIILNYIRTWFLFDFVASLPYSILLRPMDDNAGSVAYNLLASNKNQVVTTVDWLYYVCLIRLVRFIKLEKLLVHVIFVCSFNRSKNTLQMIK